jgi:decaprenyl-phosphate phosphoribosyltransferase
LHESLGGGTPVRRRQKSPQDLSSLDSGEDSGINGSSLPKEMSAESGHIGRLKVVRALVATARPRQWGKNLLVYVAPATAGVLTEPASAARASLTFVSFCLAASGLYFVNDLVDSPVDRTHPAKRHRPIAAGAISPRLAVLVATIMLGTALLIALSIGIDVCAVVAGYVSLGLAYTFVLRNVVLIDIAAIAGGFLLRAAAGGFAVNVPLSSWFLMVASFGSLFIAAGKRHAEYIHLGPEGVRYRSVLREYSDAFLRYVKYSASTVAITAYSLWAFEGAAGRTVWSGLSIIPFVLGIFRYSLLLETGRGSDPDELLFSDAALVMLGFLWIALVAIGVYMD